MSRITRPSRQNIFPTLLYRDAPAAIERLGQAFGFERHVVHPLPDGTIVHSKLRLGPCIIMLSSRGDLKATKNPWDGVEQGIYTCVEDVDALYARAKAAGAEIARGISSTDYGARELTARDPEGRLWSFGTYQPHGAG